MNIKTLTKHRNWLLLVAGLPAVYFLLVGSITSVYSDGAPGFLSFLFIYFPFIVIPAFLFYVLKKSKHQKTNNMVFVALVIILIAYSAFTLFV